MNAVEGLTTLVNNTTHVFFSKSTKDRSSYKSIWEIKIENSVAEKIIKFI